MAEKYTGIEKYIFSDLYLFFLKYKDMPNEDYYWECCIRDSNILRFKYKEHPMVVAFTREIINQLEHKVCNKPRKGLTHEQWEGQLEIAKRSTFK